MTAGPTGVFWLPRTATVNSAALAAGAGAAPLVAAASAWSTVSAAYTDVAVTLARATAELSATWSGDTAAVATDRLGGLAAWSHGVAGLAGTIAAKASAQATAYTTAVAVMPTLVEIAAVKTSKTAAYATGGAAVGAAQAAEAADTALDVRAALVMEAYESATSILAVTDTVAAPPAVTVTAVTGPDGHPTPVRGHADRDVDADPSAPAEKTVHPLDPIRLSDSALHDPAAVPDHPAATRAASAAVHAVTQVPSTLSSVIGGGTSGQVGSNSGGVGSGSFGSGGFGFLGAGGGGGAARTGSAAAGMGIPGNGVQGVDTRTHSPSPWSAATAAPSGGSSEHRTTTIGTTGDSAHSTRANVGPMPLSHSRTEDDAVTARVSGHLVRFDDGVPVMPSVIGAPDRAP